MSLYGGVINSYSLSAGGLLIKIDRSIANSCPYGRRQLSSDMLHFSHITKLSLFANTAIMSCVLVGLKLMVFIWLSVFRVGWIVLTWQRRADVDSFLNPLSIPR